MLPEVKDQHSFVSSDSSFCPRWVTEAVYAKIHGLNRQSLTNWRCVDRAAGRSEAARGYPQYRYFGAAVRYRIEGCTPAEIVAAERALRLESEQRKLAKQTEVAVG